MRLMGLALAGMVGVAASFASIASAAPSMRPLAAPSSAVENVQYRCAYGERRVCVRRNDYGECRRWVCRPRGYY